MTAGVEKPRSFHMTYTTNYLMPQKDGSIKVTTITESETLNEEEIRKYEAKIAQAVKPAISERSIPRTPSRPITATDKVLAECLHVKDAFIASLRPNDNKIHLNAKEELVITSLGMDQLVQILVQGRDKITKVDLRCCGDNVEDVFKLAEALKNTAVKVVKLQCKMIVRDANALGKAIFDLDEEERSLELTLKNRGQYQEVGRHLASIGLKSDNGRPIRMGIEYFTKALEVDKKDPNNKETLELRASAYTSLALYGKAIKDLEASLKFDPNFFHARELLSQLTSANKTKDQK